MKALLIDLDGVLRHFPDQRGIGPRFGLPADSIDATAFAPDLLQRVVTGVITDEAWRSTIAASLCARFPDADVAAALAEWSEPGGAMDSEMLSLVAECRARHRVVLVTNATSRLPHDLARLGVADAFDAIVNSSVIGHAKPDPAFYAHALAASGAGAPEACLFVDDSLTNVRAARAFGFAAHHFTGIASLREVLRPFCR